MEIETVTICGVKVAGILEEQHVRFEGDENPFKALSLSIQPDGGPTTDVVISLEGNGGVAGIATPSGREVMEEEVGNLLAQQDLRIYLPPDEEDESDDES